MSVLFDFPRLVTGWQPVSKRASLTINRSFIWALITAMVSRILLHLRSVACADSPADDASFFGPTVRSTHIVWARRNTTHLESSVHTVSTSDVRGVTVTETRSDTLWEGDEENGVRIELQGIRSGKSGMGNRHR